MPRLSRAPALLLISAALLLATSVPAFALGGLGWPFGKKTTPADRATFFTEDFNAPAGFRVRGFRHAHFGMTRAEVMGAIDADFGILPAKVQTSIDPKDQTRVLQVQVKSLAPGPGPASIRYVLGAGSRRLVRVIIAWQDEGIPSAGERAALVNDGVVLVNYFRGQAWGAGAVKAGVPKGPNSLALFVGQDADGAAVEIDVDGVRYDQQQNGRAVSSPAPQGPAMLSLTYVQDVNHADIYRLPPPGAN